MPTCDKPLHWTMPTWSNHHQSNRTRFCHPYSPRTTSSPIKRVSWHEELRWYFWTSRGSMGELWLSMLKSLLRRHHHYASIETQSSSCTWVMQLVQSLTSAYKYPVFRHKSQRHLSKPKACLHWQHHALHCRTQKTQWVPPAGTSLKAQWRDAQAQGFAKGPWPTSNKPAQLRIARKTWGTQSSSDHFSFCLANSAIKLAGAPVCLWAFT